MLILNGWTTTSYKRLLFWLAKVPVLQDETGTFSI